MNIERRLATTQVLGTTRATEVSRVAQEFNGFEGLV